MPESKLLNDSVKQSKKLLTLLEMGSSRELTSFSYLEHSGYRNFLTIKFLVHKSKMSLYIRKMRGKWSKGGRVYR